MFLSSIILNLSQGIYGYMLEKQNTHEKTITILHQNGGYQGKVGSAKWLETFMHTNFEILALVETFAMLSRNK